MGINSKSEIFKIRKRARNQRNNWGIPQNSPIKDIFSLLEEHNIDVFVIPFDSEVPGSLAKIPPEGSPAIFINLNIETKGRRVFTAAHELYHFLFDFDEPFKWDEINESNKPKVESLADVFAANFLMPSSAIKAAKEEFEIQKWSPENTVDMQMHFEVSYESLVYQLHNTDEINADKRDELLDIKPIPLALEMGYKHGDIYGNKSPSYSKKFRNLTIKAFKQGLISQKKFQDLMNYSDSQLDDVLSEIEVEFEMDEEGEKDLSEFET